MCTPIHVEFTIPHPGAPLPDLVAVNSGGPDSACPSSLFSVPIAWGDIDFISIQASITGSLHAQSGFPEGARGMMDLKQIGLNPGSPKGTGPLYDAFPVESINLKTVGP